MGLNINITDADQMNPPELRRVAAALLVLAGDTPSEASTIHNVSIGYPVRIEAPAEEVAAPLDHAVPPAPSSAAANPPPTAPGAIGAPPPPPASAPPAPTDANETSHVPTDVAHGRPALDADVDKNGLPWDGRIHASTKVKNADDSWRLRRGVAPATVDEVVAELRAQGYVEPGNAAPPPPAAQSNAAPPPPAADTGTVPPPPAPNAPAQDVPPPPGATPQPNVTIAQPATTAGVTPYIQLVKDVAAAIQAKKLTPEESAAAYQSLGLTGLDGFAKQSDLIDPYRAILTGKL